jgi:hypothetical protein
MLMINNYINQLLLELATGNALEHSYRPALKSLFQAMDSNIQAVNEPSRSAHGAPDFAFYKRTNTNLVLGYVETKDLTADLDQVEKSEQLKRYLGYANLILTNYLEFRFFRNGEKYNTIEIAKLNHSVIAPFEENYPILERELRAFLEGKPETIRSAKRLSEIMGGKAARVRDNITKYLEEENDKNAELLRVYEIMKKLLVNDLKPEKFADMYAQTLVYGLFIARYYDGSPDNFTRQEARDLVPASNPFLQHFFDHIVGPNFDRRLTYIVDELCEVFSVSDVQAIIQKHYNLFGEEVDKDPVIHFYEDFLKEYDPQLRKSMGAYYTPVPVVNFIIRAVDDVLKKEFNLPQGLADTTKVERSVMQQGTKAKQSLHKVQILDPAVGTATFLNETVKFIYQKFRGQEGVWESYVDKELLPRLHGFELMMAPYTIAHLKLAMTFKETGIDNFKKRLGIYLTNTLEEGVKNADQFDFLGLADAISEEAKAASIIKHDTPIMVVLGNPPYSGVSSNMTFYANSLVDSYKVEPGGKEKLKERKHWLNDDYVKFIAFAEKLIKKNGEGIVAMITNHGYLDNPTFRGMRWHLTQTFSSIYVFDLHGNSKRKEISPEGGKDENVFDIQQGVAIIIGIKQKSTQQKQAKIFRGDLWGNRKNKFEKLGIERISDISWSEIALNKKTFSFTKNQDQQLKQEYEKGISLADLFTQNVTGIVTMGDGFVLAQNANEIKERIQEFLSNDLSENELKERYGLGKNYAKWILVNKQNGLIFNNSKITEFTYRPFDNRWVYYDEHFIWRTRDKVANHFLNKNYGLIFSRQAITNNWSHIQACNHPVDNRAHYSNKGIPIFAPLYLYSNSQQLKINNDVERESNVDKNLVRLLLKNINSYDWVDDHEEKDQSNKSKVSPLDILDYIYAVLHSQNYRDKYKDFLKSDFPRIPVANDSKSFWGLVKLGGRLRQFHLMEDPDLENLITTFLVAGDNIIEKVEYRDSKIIFNETQYFGNVPKEAWDFYIGGYQPAQKWLKDRKGKTLTYEDVVHYQKIIKVLTETKKVMKKIDKFEIINNTHE